MIIVDRPPNFEAIRIKFPKAEGYGVLTAYDGRIYNPSGIVIPPALIAHEEVHLNRQRDAGPTLWWERYLIDSEFRYHEELLAHVAEYECLAPSHSPDRNVRSALLMHTACRLTAALYAYDPPRTMAHAMKDLRERIKNV